jgi:uncharacterized protein (DUF1499 family)
MSSGRDPYSAPPRRPLSPLAVVAVVVALLSAGVLLMAGPGAQWDWWHFRTGFRLLRWGAYGGIAAVLLGIAAAAVHARPGASRRGLGLAAAAVVVGLTVVAIPWQWQRMAGQVPPIHDISTDTQDPPEFVAVVPLRADAPNPPEYAGPEVAEQQRVAYPDLAPVMIPLARAEVFPLALQAARDMGWEIVDADPVEGRIEATDRTLWFGFADDVVIRLATTESGTRLDVRSKSRIGGSDVGANARRIRRYLARLDRMLPLG